MTFFSVQFSKNRETSAIAFAAIGSGVADAKQVRLQCNRDGKEATKEHV